MLTGATLATACRPALPTGLGAPCVLDEDCGDDLVCVTEIRESAGYQEDALLTCQVPCSEAVECGFRGVWCYTCEVDVEVPFCDFLGCK